MQQRNASEKVTAAVARNLQQLAHLVCPSRLSALDGFELSCQLPGNLLDTMDGGYNAGDGLKEELHKTKKITCETLNRNPVGCLAKRKMSN